MIKCKSKSIRIDESGNQYGDLTVVQFEETRDRIACWRCRCACGNETVVRGPELRKGKTKSCGCRRASDCLSRRTHGQATRGDATAAYRTWHSMKRRCFDPKDRNYKDYGGRGIAVCSEWAESFEAFFSDMGPRPSGTSIDRIDNSLGYFRGNCRWATSSEQAQNKRNNHWVTINGDKRLARDWAIHFRMSMVTFHKRIRQGMTPEEALTCPKYR